MGKYLLVFLLFYCKNAPAKAGQGFRFDMFFGKTEKQHVKGIPNAIKDKIMRPFFATKPTGEGTEFGLSLSYDIVVKRHGGQYNYGW